MEGCNDDPEKVQPKFWTEIVLEKKVPKMENRSDVLIERVPSVRAKAVNSPGFLQGHAGGVCW